MLNQIDIVFIFDFTFFSLMLASISSIVIILFPFFLFHSIFSMTFIKFIRKAFYFVWLINTLMNFTFSMHRNYSLCLFKNCEQDIECKQLNDQPSHNKSSKSFKKGLRPSQRKRAIQVSVYERIMESFTERANAWLNGKISPATLIHIMNIKKCK